MAQVRRFPNRGIPKPVFAILLLIVLGVVAHVWIDRLYALRLHAVLGYGSIYSKNMVFELVTRYAGALFYLLLGWWVLRPFRAVVPKPAYNALVTVGLLLGWSMGYGVWSLDASAWYLFFHHVSFHRVDPVLHMDYSFYVYTLPPVTGLVGRIVFTLAWVMAVRILAFFLPYLQQRAVTNNVALPQKIESQARVILSLGGLVLVLLTVLVFLRRYDLVLSSGNGNFIFGPDFVTTHLTLPIFTWLQVVSLAVAAAGVFWMAIRPQSILRDHDGFTVIAWRGLRRLVWPVGAYVAISVLSAIVAGIVNALYVHPNQNTVELPYIRNSIAATRYGLNIENVQAVPFQPSTALTAQGVQRDANALQNVRINDQGQTSTIYNQLQSFKSYFTFDSASVDRYDNSEVYTSARQMNVDNIPVQTWVNRTFVYTHGYGVAISPVNQFDSNGLPVMWAKDTPQTTQTPIPAVTRPEIYFGTMTNDVIAPSKEGEFDYPQGSSDHTSSYAGGDGLPVNGNRFLLMLEQGNLKFFTSDQITAKSQWLFDRNIYQRVNDIAPFLTYDQDAFPFVDSSGHILWMLDAYTETSNLPYSQTFMNTTYIRNSVKVVMDAYTGKVTFYVVDPKDPLLQSLEAVYPGVFTTQIPPDVAAHFRYPRDLFQAQANALTRYHMTDAAAFYNQEDLWAIANQIYQQNQQQPRPPVYQMIRMPDRDQTQFVISELFTPANKDNLNGWLIADNQPGVYGRLTLYQFPQSSLIFGPMQAENQIDADPNISAQLTLWNQQGSHVVRGDVLLVPVGDTLLYVEPVYLVADRANSLPQLERVIINYNQKVVMDTSLGAALQDLLGGAAATTPEPNAPGAPSITPGGGTTSGNSGALVSQANQLFQQYEADTAKGDFVAAGNDLKQLGAVLGQLRQLSGKSTQH